MRILGGGMDGAWLSERKRCIKMSRDFESCYWLDRAKLSGMNVNPEAVCCIQRKCDEPAGHVTIYELILIYVGREAG